MNKFFWVVLLSLTATTFNCFGQKKIIRYCIITPVRSHSPDKFHIEIDLGTPETFPALRDSNYVKKIHFVDHMQSDADILNYMSSLGWTLDHVSNAVLTGYRNLQTYYLKKEFDE
jgi:hypothetical protein